MSAFDLIKMKAEAEDKFINFDVESFVTWTPIVLTSDRTLVDLLKAMDDGSCHGFHYRINNGVLECTQDDIEQEFVNNLLTIKISDKY